ncbi:DUF4178 domain-containing protein [Erythrobacter sp. HKB08]|uniref:DUF4178 domain-containing protein n=1 Tax=Erythrobacter sp. HKB08 TaxID=2502843 RepID=UPI0013E8A2ED|nr:DUF4178 domain-containing protein [Erythrobacter sp. HKB08]
MTAIETPSVKAITCPSCGGSIELRAAGFTTLLVCQYCSSELDLSNPDVKLISEHAQAAGELTIPLGTKGTLNGIDWVVTGYIERDDGWGLWSEFLLFNPYHGYRWLTHSVNGWSFGTSLMTQPGHPRSLTQRYNGRLFNKCFALTTNKVEYALGEFYWQVRRGDESEVTEYVSGDQMLACEVSGDEFNWTLEQWISSEEVAAAFGIEDTGQYPQVGEIPQAHQPNPHWKRFKEWGIEASAALLIAIVFIIALGSSGPRSEVRLDTTGIPSTKTATLGPFTVDRTQPFTIETQGFPGDNNWLDVSYTLTELDTGQEYVANQPIEYYYGPDWKEDNRSGTIKISSVPAGRYELSAEVFRPEDEPNSVARRRNLGLDNTNFPTRTVIVRAGPGGVFWSNLFLLFLALFAPVGWALYRAMAFESARRSDYDYGGSDDDD